MPRIRIIDNASRERFRRAFDSSILGKCLVSRVMDNGTIETRFLDEILVDDCERYANRIEDLRELYEAETKTHRTHERSTAEKEGLPLWYPGGEIDENGKLLRFSNLMAINIDLADNPTFASSKMIRDTVSKIPYVAYCGLSCRAAGVVALVYVPDNAGKESYFSGYFSRFGELLRKKGIIIPPTPSKPTDGRFISLDRFAYWNLAPAVFEEYGRSPIELAREKVCAILERAEEEGKTIADTRENLVSCAYALAEEFGEEGESLYLRTAKLFEDCTGRNYTDRAAETFRDCLERNEGKTKIGTFFHLAKIAGLTFK